MTRVAALERRISVGRLRGATRGRGTSDEAPVLLSTIPPSPHPRRAVRICERPSQWVFKKDPYLDPRRLMGLALSDCKAAFAAQQNAAANP